MRLQEETTLRYHSELNPKLWDNGKLKDDVLEALRKIANAWREYSAVKPEDVFDIVMTGGNANYNYTEQSDIDIHLIVDYSKYGEHAREYFLAMKSNWAHSHSNVTVKGYPVELFAQDKSDSHPDGQGVYSIARDEWIQYPEYLGLDLEHDSAVELTAKEISCRIKATIVNDRGLDVAKQLANDIYNLRSSGISESGEFSRGTLIFKELRNLGDLDKLKKYISTQEDKQYTLE